MARSCDGRRNGYTSNVQTVRPDSLGRVERMNVLRALPEARFAISAFVIKPMLPCSSTAGFKV